MSLNIKNPETQKLARLLARQTGETMTAAITVALKERLERRMPNPKTGLAAWLGETSRQTAPLLRSLPPSGKVGDLLFDKETGLPL